MKVLHIEGISKESYKLTAEAIDKLPKGKAALCTTIQFIGSLQQIKEQLKDAVLLQGKHSSKQGQILGCDVPQIEGVDFILFVGDGTFHPKALFLKNNLPVFAYNPFNEKLMKMDEKEVEGFAKKRKIALTKFHASENIGVIQSTKPGQSISDSKLSELEQKYKEKRFYKFVADTIDFSQLENFPFIESWVNTACPRIAYDDAPNTNKAIINIDDLK